MSIRIRELYQIGVSPKLESCFLKFRSDHVSISSLVKGSPLVVENQSPKALTLLAGHISSIGGTELTPFLGGNLIKVGGNKLTPMTS